MTKTRTAIVWFRQDLRLKDNPAFRYAATNGYSILPVYILDDENAGEWKMGGASRWWLHESLNALNESLSSKLRVYKGKADDLIPELVKDLQADAIFWNRCYEPWRVERDKKIKENLKENGIETDSFNASLLWEPWTVKKDDGTPYRVFTPYYRKGCLKREEPPKAQETPKDFTLAQEANDTDISDLDLLPKIKWYSEMAECWQPGEDGAQKCFKQFMQNGLKGYKEDRNRPDLENVSRLSPYLHFGEISPRDVWHEIRAYGFSKGLETDTDHFCSELGWREFSHSLLYYNDNLPREPIQEKFGNFPWVKDENALECWQKGKTGIPIVDAGMRQLWRTGWMHNRVRMIVASLLIKNMQIHWHDGENWFWDCLIDADLANNAASWQWVAGCGADAAPYFRIFNPVLQGKKFDPDGKYVREFVPELKNMPDDKIHTPWESSKEILAHAGVTLGKDYPHPIIDLKKSREKALEAYQEIK